MGHYLNPAFTILIALICINVNFAHGTKNCSSSQPEIVGYIHSPRITKWGVWGEYEYCPPCSHAKGFQLKVEPKQGNYDDTALNAVRLICNDPSSTAITSSQGKWGDWGQKLNCPGAGKLFAAEFKTEKYRKIQDDTAANNVMFECGDASLYGNIKIEASGGKWGKWFGYGKCAPDSYICGIKTQVEPDQGSGDNTALNNIDFACCK